MVLERGRDRGKDALGQVTRVKGHKVISVNTQDIGRTMRIFARLAFVLLVSGYITGCAEVKVRVGTSIDLPALHELQIGESTSDEVLALLGHPYGEGRSYLPFQAEHRDMWSYYYEIGTLSDDRRTFLFVYFDDEIYDGHMWFSSLPDTLR